MGPGRKWSPDPSLVQWVHWVPGPSHGHLVVTVQWVLGLWSKG